MTHIKLSIRKVFYKAISHFKDYVYKSFSFQGKADKFCNHVFKVFDFDDSGQIDFTEFLIAISVTAQGDAKRKLSMAFKM